MASASLSHPTPLSALPLADLEAAVAAFGPTDNTGLNFFLQHSTNAWVKFEADVRNAASTALNRLRSTGIHADELLRLCEHEEQTRCHAFQGAMMGEVGPDVYKAAVRSILEKLLGKLETYAPEPSLYQAAAQCLSEYMSALNHHCDICSDIAAPATRVASHSSSLPAIPENACDGADVSHRTGTESESNQLSEIGSEDGETLSVHSENTDHSGRFKPSRPVTLGAAAASSGSGAGEVPHDTASGGGLLRMIPAGSTVVPVPVAAFGPMTDEMRRERRRESNKKASVKYRSRKAGTLQQALSDCATARQQVSALSSQNAVLAAENQLLKQQVAFLQGILQKKGGHEVAGTAAAAPLMSAAALPMAPPLATTAPPPYALPSAAAQAAGVALAPPPPLASACIPLPSLGESLELAPPPEMGELEGASVVSATDSFGQEERARQHRGSRDAELEDAMLMSIDSIAMCDMLAL